MDKNIFIIINKYKGEEKNKFKDKVFENMGLIVGHELTDDFWKYSLDMIFSDNDIKIKKVDVMSNEVKTLIEKAIYITSNELDESNCANCGHSIDFECNTKFECEIDGSIHYSEDTCEKFIE